MNSKVNQEDLDMFGESQEMLRKKTIAKKKDQSTELLNMIGCDASKMSD